MVDAILDSGSLLQYGNRFILCGSDLYIYSSDSETIHKLTKSNQEMVLLFQEHKTTIVNVHINIIKNNILINMDICIEKPHCYSKISSWYTDLSVGSFTNIQSGKTQTKTKEKKRIKYLQKGRRKGKGG